MSMYIFDYLNVKHLDACIAFVEGGIYNEVSRRSKDRVLKNKSGSGDAKLMKGSFGKDSESESEEERLVLDTKEARFSRLMSALNDDPDTYNYEEILDPSRLNDLTVGTWVTVTCEVEIPPKVKLLSQGDELESTLDLVERFRPLAQMVNPETNMPEPGQISAMRAVSGVKMDPIVVGIIEDDAPKVVGKLLKTYLADGLPEGDKLIFGKVARVWKEGTKYPVLALPGASLMNREQRRKAANSASGDDVVEGPGVTLEIVAIYT